MNDIIIPFLKWAGGKRWLVKKYQNLFPMEYNNYYEPFLGAGSVYFHLQPQRAVLSDLNAELILTYQVIQNDWQALQELLILHQERHNKVYYYQMRDSLPNSLVEAAARFIYLNRTCFNGIYRVNLQGKFNVPKGSKDTVILDTDDFESVSAVLAGAELRHSDFETIINEASLEDFLFADPPYTVRHNQNGFIKYNENIFSWSDQVRLADSLWRAKNRGVKVLSTNANHDSVRELYVERGFEIRTVSRYSSISATAANRNQYEEILLRANT